MLKRADPSARRRLSGAALVAVLSAGVGYAAWAAAPATAPAAAAPLAYIEEALAPEPAPEALGAAAAEPQIAQSQVDPADIDAQGRPRYGRAFAERYDINDPITVKGVVVRVDWMQPNAALWIYGQGVGKDGADLGEQLWRVDGGAPQSVSLEARVAWSQIVGERVLTRGHATKDKSCSPTCRLNGAVTFIDGETVFETAGGKPECSLEQLRNFSCPGSDKPSPAPIPPTEAEIAQVMARADKDRARPPPARS